MTQLAGWLYTDSEGDDAFCNNPRALEGLEHKGKRPTPLYDLQWHPIATAPKDGTQILLLVKEPRHALEDETLARTIGWNNLAHDGEDVWKLAGWDWSQDCFREGQGEPVKWMPIPFAEQTVEKPQ